MTLSPAINKRFDDLFASIDAGDISAFLAFLTQDAVFRFGSAPAVSGREAIRQAVEGFFSTIKSCRHEIYRKIQDETTVVCEGEVTYRRHDGSELTLPFANVFELAGDLIHGYRIYIDIGPLFET